jgi:farnesyl-diphosphate farnesyltransferase
VYTLTRPDKEAPLLSPLSEEQLLDLLIKTSRTFAISIPVLEQPLRREVMVAYLLFRIADTFEDAAGWPIARRVQALESLAGVLDGVREPSMTTLVTSWLEGKSATSDQGYLELLRESPRVVDAFRWLEPRSHQLIAGHVRRTALGMAEYIAGSDSEGQLKLESVGDLERYCYIVAGIVGELLTELFLLREPALAERGKVTEELRSRAVDFGEALQLVNILKDSAADEAEGRSFLPVPRQQVFERARADLEVAREYVIVLEEAKVSSGIRAFVALPVLLAELTLAEVERRGPGAKVPRDKVLETVNVLNRRLRRGRSVFG